MTQSNSYGEKEGREAEGRRGERERERENLG